MGKPRPKCPDCGCEDPVKSMFCHNPGFPNVGYGGVWGGNDLIGVGGSPSAGMGIHPVKSITPTAYSIQVEPYDPLKRSGPVFDFVDADNYHALLRVPQSTVVDCDWDLVRVQAGSESIVDTITLPWQLHGINKRANGFFVTSAETYPHIGYRVVEEYPLTVSALGGRFVGLRTDDPTGDSFAWRYWKGDSARYMCTSLRGGAQGQFPQSVYADFSSGGLTDGDCVLCDDLTGVVNLTWQTTPAGGRLRFDLGSCDCPNGVQPWAVYASLHSRSGQEYWVVRVCLVGETWDSSLGDSATITTCPRATAIYESGLYPFQTFENNSGFPVSLTLVDSYLKDWCGGAFPSPITLSV